MSKYGINVPKGVAISSLDEVPKVISEAFPDKDEVNTQNFADWCLNNLS